MAREQLVAQVVRLVLRGRSVDVVGDRGTGRTTVLERVGAELVDREWSAVRLRGLPALRGAPFAALSLAGIAPARDARTVSIAAAVDELCGLLPAGRGVVLVDDEADLDEASRGVVAAAGARTGAPIVQTRTREAGVGPALPLSVALTPLGYDEFEDALAEHAGIRFDPSTMSQLFALSAGHIGHGLALFDAAVVERRLDEVDGRLVARADLWCASLAAPAESLLEALDATLREALELLAFVGPVDIAALQPVIGDTTFERLEANGLIALVDSGPRSLVAVTPPLIAEHIRSSTPALRRGRLLGTIETLRRPDDDLLPMPSEEEPPAHQDAQFVRVVHERLRARQLVARSEWSRMADRSAAVFYLDASIRMPLADASVDRIFAETAAAPGDEESAARWEALDADHRAFHHREAATAVARLREAAPSLPHFGGLLLAKAVELELLLLGNPETDTLPDPDDPDLPEAVRIDLHQTLAHVLTSRGDVAASERHLEAAATIGAPDGMVAGLLHGMNLLLAGDLAGAALLAAREFDIARAQLDPERMRGFGHLLCVCGVFSGDLADADEVIRQVRALGDPVSVPPFADRDLAIVASVIAARRGRRETAERLLADASRAALPSNPLPGGNLGWAEAQLLAGRGDLEAAADRLAADGDEAWGRGATVTAALAYLAACEVDASPSRLALHRPRIAEVRVALVADQLEYVVALVERSPDRLAAAAHRAEASGRFSLALAGLRRAAQEYAQSGLPAREKETADAADRLEARLSPRRIETARFVSDRIELTVRERQVVRLAAEKWTNAQIATELVLSLRTVESHLHKAMRKIGAQRRTELAAYLEGDDLDR
ncbi:LuxR family transcriptional regulator [Leifsonia sp. C5G2]|uniref:helix-turn-helix transcriptional regulator n=1 Tax=Leifsonia sp. C5G2 TaxID=2735269 RepID=UPI0015845926|nr:LuxR family transcriptional regulator [Leifsonia sp. C5G2]NUU05976.1 hypothetical protein [Leifsonia sp. C5G2]